MVSGRAGVDMGRIVRQFFIQPVDDHALPAIGRVDLIKRNTDTRIVPHPFDLSAKGRERIEKDRVIGESERNDIGVIIVGAGQAANARAA